MRQQEPSFYLQLNITLTLQVATVYCISKLEDTIRITYANMKWCWKVILFFTECCSC